MKTYLVTGAAGFIGANYLKYILAKHDDIKVVVLDALTYAGNLGTIASDIDNERCFFVKGDICDQALADQLFAEYKFDYVVNFAAESHVDRSIENPQLFLQTNILGTQNLLDAARRAWVTGKDEHGYPTWRKDVRYHQVSTDEVYGSLGAEGFFTEETPLCPHSPYSASKTSADMIVMAYRDTYKMPVTITRCSNNYGPYHFPEKLIPLIIKNILEGKKLPVYGDGSNVRDWLYVEDHCKAIDLVVRRGRNGEVYNLSLMRKFQTSPDRELRRKAWKAVSDYFLSVTDEIDEIYDKMVKNRTEQARQLGYENYVELGYYRMNRNCYDKEMVENFRKQVKEYFVPFANKLHEQRRARIGVEKLSYIDTDVYFTNGNPAPVGTPEEILAAGQKMYSELSPQTKEFFDFMMENELFDVLGRKTKRQGGYMTYIPNFKSPFIFANFNGTSGDVDVITHECGHAFQGYLLRDEEIREFADITMETAEIHSMSMEYFAYNWMELFFGDRKDDYLKMHLEDSAAFVPYGCMVDEFQHIVYEKPEMTPAERKAVWAGLEKVYRPHMDYEEDPFFGQGGFWQKQPHIFGSPFYYIDYCLASVCAMQFKVMMLSLIHI